ncbi:MAG TPA: ABC transporter substrate-binding protein [Chloroflexota bacterium]|nr:ABC transporter substrate-binding protein [Chloroflexota bacterium]
MRYRHAGALLLSGVVLLLAACGGATSGARSGASAATAAASAKPATSAAPSGSASAPAASQGSAASKPAAGTSAAAKPSGQLATVSVGGLGGTPDRALWIGQDEGFYTKEGVNPDVTLYKGFGEMLPLLATGKLDVGVGGISPGFFNALLSGVNVKVVSDSTLIAEPPPGKHMSYGLMVRKDLEGQVKTVADMKGRSIAVNGVQGIGELQLDAILHLGNLTTADVDVQSIPFPDAYAALGNKKIDGALEVEPFVTLGIQQNVAFPLADLAKAMPNSPAQWVFYSTEFIKNRPDAGKRFLAAYTEALRLNSDALFKNKNRDEVIQLYIKHTQAKDPKAYDQQTPTVDETNAHINLQALQQAEDYFVAHGWQKSKLDVNSVVDTSFGDYVRQTLGTYS